MEELPTTERKVRKVEFGLGIFEVWRRYSNGTTWGQCSMAVLIGAIYVWALYGLLFGLNVLRFSHFEPLLGIAFALGLARLAQRHSPKKLAWGVLGPNPGWALLLFYINNFVIRPTQPDLTGEDYAYAQAFAVVFAIGALIGVVATFLCLGLKVDWEEQSDFGVLFLIRTIVLIRNRTGQIVLGTVLSGLFGSGLVWIEGFHFGWTPSLFETYALLGLSLAGIIWALSHEQTAGTTATA